MNKVSVGRAKSLLDHFAEIEDNRQSFKVMYPLSEVLLLVVCGTVAACDDYDDIVLWGKKHLGFLRGLQEYHYGIPCADWLRVVMNRIGPELFASCFLNFVAERLPGAVGQIAIACPGEGRGQDLAAQPWPWQGPGGAAPGLGLCDDPQLGAGPARGCRQVQ